jgi:hypothetical protein
MSEPVTFSMPQDADRDTWVWWDDNGNKHGAVSYPGKYKITWYYGQDSHEGFDFTYQVPGGDALPGNPNYYLEDGVGYKAQDEGNIQNLYPGFDKVGCDKDDNVQGRNKFKVWNDVRLTQDFTEEWEPIRKKHNSYQKELSRKRVTVLGIPFGGEVSFAAAQKIYSVEKQEIESLVASLNSQGEKMAAFAEEHMGGNIPNALFWSIITSLADPTPILGSLNAVVDEIQKEKVKQVVHAFIDQVAH